MLESFVWEFSLENVSFEGYGGDSVLKEEINGGGGEIYNAILNKTRLNLHHYSF